QRFGERADEPEFNELKFTEALEATATRLHLDLSTRAGRLQAAAAVARQRPDLTPVYGWDSVAMDHVGAQTFRELQRTAAARGVNFREAFPRATRELLGKGSEQVTLSE